MDDFTAIRLCAEALNLSHEWDSLQRVFLVGTFDDHSPHPKMFELYDPLHDDAQMAALIKHFRLHIDQRPGKHVTAQDPHFMHLIERPDGQLNAAVVYCVAAMQRAKGAG